MTGEAGEFADLVKKINFHGHTQDNDHLIKELGDVLWYIALGAEVIGTDLETVAQANINKLWNRYPNGFEEKRSINREKNDI